MIGTGGSEAVYASAEIEPVFEENKIGFIPFLQQRITATIKNKYKNHWIVKDTDGEITIIIEKDGSILDFQIYELDEPTLRNELLEMIRTALKWKPAIQNGTPARFYKKMKFNFVMPTKK